MPVAKKAKATKDQMVGAAKKSVGKATGDRATERRGSAQEARGKASAKAQRAAGSAKAKVEKAKGSVRSAAKKLTG